MMYEFECAKGHRSIEIVSMKERDALSEKCPKCRRKREQVWSKPPCATFKQTFGKWTGTYDYDYGKKATWDLTPPGKIEALRRQGVMAPDPFDSVPEKKNLEVEL